MAILEILSYPNPVLQKKAEPVKVFDGKLRKLVADMIETMRVSNGIGLAAPQIGKSVRLIVVEVPEEDGEPAKEVFAVCNPVITKRSGEAKIEEGCLSCPGLYVEVDRSKEITLEGQTPEGEAFKLEADGLLSICFQHEIDHIDGKLLVNYVSTVKRNLYRDEMKKKKAENKKDRRPAL